MFRESCRWWCERARAKATASASASPSFGTRVGKVELQRRILVTLLTVLSFFFPTVFTTALAFFTCYRLKNTNPAPVYAGSPLASHYHPQMQLHAACVTILCCTQTPPPPIPFLTAAFYIPTHDPLHHPFPVAIDSSTCPFKITFTPPSLPPPLPCTHPPVTPFHPLKLVNK